MNSNFKANLDPFLLFLKVMFNQDFQSHAHVDASDTLSQSIIKTWDNELSTTDDERLNTVDPIQVSNAYKMLNHFIKDKTKTKIEKNEDEVDVFGRLLAIRLRQFSHIERQEIMYEIDGIFLDRYRQLNCSKPAIQVNNYSDSDPYVTPPGDYLVSEDSNISVNHIIDGMLGSPVNYMTDESYNSAISFESFASFDGNPNSTHMFKDHHGLKVCNNMTCDATQTYVKKRSPSLIFECE